MEEVEEVEEVEEEEEEQRRHNLVKNEKEEGYLLTGTKNKKEVKYRRMHVSVFEYCANVCDGWM